MKKYINANALLAAYDAAHKGPPGAARKLIEDAPAANVVPEGLFLKLLSELESAERALIWEYSCDTDSDLKDLDRKIKDYRKRAGITDRTRGRKERAG